MAEASESTPLLGSEAVQSDISNGETGISATSPAATNTVFASDYFKRPIKILTFLIFISSIIDIILTITSTIIENYGPFSQRPYYTENVLFVIGVSTLATLILALVNLRFAFPILLNIIADFILSWTLTFWVHEAFNYGWPGCRLCDPGYTYPGSPPVFVPPTCEDWKLPFQILVGITAGFAGLIALAHFVLLVLRVVASFKARFWERPLGLWFPTGEVTVAVTIKVLRQQPPVEEAVPAGPAVQVENA